MSSAKKPEKEEPQASVSKPVAASPIVKKPHTPKPKLKRRPAVPNFTETCHSCKRKYRSYAYFYCKVCGLGFCSICVEERFVSSMCPVCRHECECRDCQEKNFRKDAGDLEMKGVDLRKLYPFDLGSMYRVNGFWVRELNVRRDGDSH